MDVIKEPDLIESVVNKKINNFLLQKAEPSFGEKLSENIKYVWSQYIRPNLFTLFFLLILGIFLYYRYKMTLKEKEKLKKKRKAEKLLKVEQDQLSQVYQVLKEQEAELNYYKLELKKHTDKQSYILPHNYETSGKKIMSTNTRAMMKPEFPESGFTSEATRKLNGNFLGESNTTYASFLGTNNETEFNVNAGDFN